MKRLLGLIVLASVSGVVGCQSQEEQTAQVPPPAYQEAEFEPVQVEPVEEADVEAPSQQEQQAQQQQQPGQLRLESPRQRQPEPNAQRTYTIREGDTLWSIADRVYGDGQRWVDILDANPGLQAERLPVGEQIALP